MGEVSAGDTLERIFGPPVGPADHGSLGWATWAPQILLPALDPWLSVASFDPPLIDTFALITRSGARLSRPVEDFVARVTAHLLERIVASHLGR